MQEGLQEIFLQVVINILAQTAPGERKIVVGGGEWSVTPLALPSAE